jgi:hypothetical protein
MGDWLDLDPVWTLWRRENLLSLPGIGFPAHSLVTLPAAISWLLTNHMLETEN